MRGGKQDRLDSPGEKRIRLLLITPQPQGRLVVRPMTYFPVVVRLEAENLDEACTTEIFFNPNHVSVVSNIDHAYRLETEGFSLSHEVGWVVKAEQATKEDVEVRVSAGTSRLSQVVSFQLAVESRTEGVRTNTGGGNR